MNIRNPYLNDLMERIVRRDPQEREFHQAVHEVLSSLAPVVDAQPELAAQFQIMSIPTLMVVKNGQITQRVVGARPKNQILALVQEG